VDARGARLQLELGYPTILTLEVVDEPVEMDQFQVAGYSHPQPTIDLPRGASLFPSNTLTDFSIALPQEILLEGGWEVALASMTLPPSAVNSTVWAMVEDEIYYFDMSKLNTVDALVGELIKNISNGAYGGRIGATLTKDGSATVGDRYNLGIAMPKSTSTQQDVTPVAVILSGELLRRFGYRPNRAITRRINLGPGQAHTFNIPRSLTDIITERHPPTALVYCSAVEPSIVADSMVPLLQIIPVGEDLFSGFAGFFEPKHLLFLNTLQRKFSSIQIQIKQLDGSAYPLQTLEPGDSIIVNLLFRRK
jgi:hypothetical protein